MLIWFQDINWPGLGTVVEFIVEILESFKLAVKETLCQVIDEEDDGWIYGLLALAERAKLITEKSFFDILIVLKTLATLS